MLVPHVSRHIVVGFHLLFSNQSLNQTEAKWNNPMLQMLMNHGVVISSHMFFLLKIYNKKKVSTFVKFLKYPSRKNKKMLKKSYIPESRTLTFFSM